MPVPFKHFAWYIRIVLQAVNYARHAARQGNLGVRHAVAHSIARTNSYGNFRLRRHFHKLVYKGHHKAVKIRPCNIFKVAARHNARLKRFRYRIKVHFHSLAAGLFKLFENMVIAAGNQYSRFPDA